MKTLLPRSGLFLLFAFFISPIAHGGGSKPGPEADGVYSCGNAVNSKYHELGLLELKGRTYRAYERGDAPDKRGEFLPFTIDDKGNIKWTGHFNFLSYSGTVVTSTYAVQNGKPVVGIHYADNHKGDLMICTQDK